MNRKRQHDDSNSNDSLFNSDWMDSRRVAGTDKHFLFNNDSSDFSLSASDSESGKNKHTETLNGFIVKDSKKDRNKNSLGSLTKKFIQLIEESDGQSIDVNKASEKLHVKRRRIYDITSVLDGLGLIEKISKSQIHWRGTTNIPSDRQLDKELISIRKEAQTAQKELLECNQQIETLLLSFQEISSTQTYSDMAYITTDDLHALTQTEENTSKQLVVIKSPPSSTLQIPSLEAARHLQGTPDMEGMDYQLHVSSKTDPIIVFTLEHENAEKSHPSMKTKTISKLNEICSKSSFS